MYHIPPFYHVLEAQEARPTPACTQQTSPLPRGIVAHPLAEGRTLPASLPAKEAACLTVAPAAAEDDDTPARSDSTA